MKTLAVSILLLCTTSISFAFDLDFEKGTFFGSKMMSSQKATTKVLGDDFEQQFDHLLGYYDRGFSIEVTIPQRRVNAYNVYFMGGTLELSGTTSSELTPFSGSTSFGMSPDATFDEVLDNIKKSKIEYVAFSGSWCITFKDEGCNTPGYLIALKINNIVTAEISFNDKEVLTDVRINDMSDRGFKGRVRQIYNSGNMEIISKRTKVI